MKKCFLPLSFSLILMACNNGQGLRKLSKEEAFTRQVAEIRAETKTRPPLTKDVNGNEIDMNQPITMSFDSIGFDYYVDSNDSLVLQVIRLAEPDDKIYSDKLDSILIADPVFLEKYIQELDEETKNDVRKAYTEFSYLIGPLKTHDVDCTEIGRLLQEALIEDQRSRTELTHTGAKTDRQNQELVMSIFEVCGAIKIEEAGLDAIDAAFMIVQHGQKDFRIKYFNYFQDWTKRGFLSPSTLALMIDRMQTDADLKQIYGTQVRKHQNGHVELLPLIDPERVNYRRDSVGLEPLEEYLKRFESNR